jgi:HD-GYP domain-containing protein (c-di-GMP phosphodiesterase class II)
MRVPLSLDLIELEAPLPLNIWDGNGVLLLRRGEVIRDQEHRQLLQARAPVADEDELRQWTFRYTTEIDRKLRGNASLSSIASVARPMGVETGRNEQERSVPARWADLHTSMGLLLHQGEQAQDFSRRLGLIRTRMEEVLQSRTDDSLFVLVQMLLDRSLGYSTGHALLCALLCRIVGKLLLKEPGELDGLINAALTMNIGMTRLQDELALQPDPLSIAQRTRIEQHPLLGVRTLQHLGVNDENWLRLVRHHHAKLPTLTDLERAEPQLLLAHLISLVDVFVARISPRVSRKGLPSQQAARDAYLDVNGQANPLGAALIKAVGVYIPGSYVRLVSGELAVVVRRQRRANAPLVFALVGRSGMPLGEPALRDTSEAAYEIKAGLAADEVRVRVNPSKLLARL